MAGEKEDRSIDPNIGDRVFFAREKEGREKRKRRMESGVPRSKLGERGSGING